MNGTRTTGFTAILIVGAVTLAAAQSPVRKIERRTGTPIAELIRNGEPAIELLPAAAPPLIVDIPSSGSLVETRLKESDVVLLVRLEGRRSRLSERSDWVESDLDARVVEVYKAPAAARLKPGAKLGFVEEGGEIDVKGTKVRANVPWFRPFEQGRTYLMMLGIDPTNGRIVLEADGVYELADGRFSRLSKPRAQSQSADEIEQDLSDHVLADLRARSQP